MEDDSAKILLGAILYAAFLIALGFLLFASEEANAQGRFNPERFYQDQWCNEHGGRTEVVQEDSTRVDCITYAHAIEFDFADKWAEALAQALHYSIMTDMPPGIVLIVEEPDDMRFVQRLAQVITTFSIDVELWVMSRE